VILTVTLNAALDVTYDVERVDWHAANRVARVRARAGGKGINVARVLHALGEDVVVTGLAGGPAGGAVREELAAAGLPDALVSIAGETRRTLTVVDAATGDATGFWEPGPTATADEWERFLAAFAGLVADAAVVVLSGSLPPGVPPDAYAVLCRTAACPTILDTSGEALRHGLAGGPAIVKPNAAELAEIAAGESADRDAAAAGGRAEARGGDSAGGDSVGGGAAGIVAAARRMRTAGAGAVVVSLGAEGLVAITEDGVWRARPPEAVRGNPTGAGDAVVAALAAGLAAGRGWPDRLAEAVALSAAAVHAPAAGEFDDAAYRRYRELVRAEAL
jgi:tagatose 6-phosphate kinase